MIVAIEPESAHIVEGSAVLYLPSSDCTDIHYLCVEVSKPDANTDYQVTVTHNALSCYSMDEKKMCSSGKNEYSIIVKEIK